MMNEWISRPLLLLCYLFTLFFWLNLFRSVNGQESLDNIHHYTIEFQCRMGNLMFQYAALLGICHKNQAKNEDCAVICNSNFYEIETPIKEFVSIFNLSTHQSKEKTFKFKNKYREHPEDWDAIKYDNNVYKQPSGTKFIGYFQSWKYFHPHLSEKIKNIYKFPNDIEDRSKKIIESIHYNITSMLPNKKPSLQNEKINNNYKIVGIHFRLGDKLNNKFYDQYSVSKEYFLRAISLIQQRYNVKKLIYLFFIGGGLDKKTSLRDELWVKQNLAIRLNNVFYESSGNHIIAMRSLSLCDIIIAGQSSYSWWAAYLSNTLEVIFPRHMFGKLKIDSKEPFFEYENYFLPWWTLLSSNQSEDRIIGYNPNNTFYRMK